MKLKFIVYILVLFVAFSCSSTETENDSTEQSDIQELFSLETTDQTNETDTKSNSDLSLSLSTQIIVILIIVVILIATIAFFIYFVPLKLWYETRLSGIRVSWMSLIFMRWQSVPQDLILKILIKAENAGLSLKANDLSEHYLAEVDIEKVVNTLIRATNAGLNIELKDLAAQFLAKVDVEKMMHALITARNSDLDVTIQQLASQYLANVDVEQVVEALVSAHNSGYDEMNIDGLKEHFLAGGHVSQTVQAFVAARKANLPDFTFEDVAAIDLAGIDVIGAINSAITPRVVETDGVIGFARDGVQLTMKVKITLRAYVRNIIGGAQEETVLARVNEALITVIGQSDTHYAILQSPYELADSVEKQDHGKGTAYEVLSVDVSNIVVGKDIAAELRIERAKAETAMARAEVLKAEEKVQKAMAAAFIDGNISVHQYHEMKNTEADTKMRESLSDSVSKKDDDDEHHH